MIDRIRLAGVRVSEQAGAVDFYTWQLGFRLRADLPAGGERWVEVGSSSGRTALALTVAGPGRRRAPCGTSRIVFVTEDLEGTHWELKSAGVPFVLEP